MKTTRLSCLWGAAGFLIVLVTSAPAQQAAGERATATSPTMMAQFGKREYEAKCASCHGTTGKGDGVVQPFLIKSARDLTTLAKQNGGVLPANALYEMISGTSRSTAHGTSEMPVWGKEYEGEFARRYRDVPDDQETYTRTRILALIEYIDRLQTR